ncbi:MAG: hypothetical protein EOP53_20340 [Sphingobacteriales bacterium]|nr:MAG: hypothetical protein EOP53_20340 [Sphingobacteriales bacterium]
MHNFTTEDLLQYLYKEASTEKTAAIGVALLSDWNLREKLDVLKGSQAELNTVMLVSPRKQTIDNILAYAEKSVEEFSEKA